MIVSDLVHQLAGELTFYHSTYQIGGLGGVIIRSESIIVSEPGTSLQTDLVGLSWPREV